MLLGGQSRGSKLNMQLAGSMTRRVRGGKLVPIELLHHIHMTFAHAQSVHLVGWGVTERLVGEAVERVTPVYLP